MSAYISLPARRYRIPEVMDVAKRMCTFVRYQDRKLWYRVEWKTDVHNDPQFPGASVTEINVFEFPVPVDDSAATGTFEPELKAISLTRWIRLHREFMKAAVDGG